MAETIARPRTCVVGLVVDKVDKLIHGMEFGAAGMHSQVQQRVDQFEWFKQTADLTLAGDRKIAINDSLQDLLLKADALNEHPGRILEAPR